MMQKLVVAADVIRHTPVDEQVVQSTMRANAIVIVPPSFCHGPCFIERQEPVLVQTLVAKPTIERLNERIIRWLSWPAEV